MIYGIGTDIIEISRIEKAIQKKSFMQNIFTKNDNISMIKVVIQKPFQRHFVQKRQQQKQ